MTTPRTPEEWRRWLVAMTPRDGDLYADGFRKLGEAWITVLGAAIDLLLELQAERERFRGIR